MNKIKKLIINPVWGIKRIYEKLYASTKYQKEHIITFKNFLSKVTNDNIDNYHNIIKDYADLTEVHKFVNDEYKNAGLPYKYPPDRYGWTSFLFYYTRKTRPEKVVETGCWYGNSSIAILSALYLNNFGKLYTIDLPAYKETGGYYDENPYIKENERTEYLPVGKSPGFIIPGFLKGRWELIYGKTGEKLPVLLEKLNSIDYFLHDSLHSVENMNFEFNLAYTYLRKEGMIFSDNIDWNSVFKVFTKDKKAYTYLAYYEHWKLKPNFGAIRKL